MLHNEIPEVCYFYKELKNNLFFLCAIYKAYGIIFWDNSLHSNIFKLQKRTIIIIMNVENRVSCCKLFKKILPLHSQYILSLLSFVVKNMEEFITNSEVHSINTRPMSDLYPP